jgi:hypothetical protein
MKMNETEYDDDVEWARENVSMPTDMDSLFRDILEKDVKLTSAAVEYVIKCRFGETATEGRAHKFAKLAWKTLYWGEEDRMFVLHENEIIRRSCTKVCTDNVPSSSSSRWEK